MENDYVILCLFQQIGHLYFSTIRILYILHLVVFADNTCVSLTHVTYFPAPIFGKEILYFIPKDMAHNFLR